MSTENPFLSVIKIWAAAAWADGEIADAEAKALRALINSAELPAADRTTALTWLDSRVELDAAPAAGLSEPARKGVYQAAVRMVSVDKKVTGTEEALLRRLRVALKLDDETVNQLEADVKAFAASKKSQKPS